MGQKVWGGGVKEGQLRWGVTCGGEMGSKRDQDPWEQREHSAGGRRGFTQMTPLKR